MYIPADECVFDDGFPANIQKNSGGGAGGGGKRNQRRPRRKSIRVAAAEKLSVEVRSK